MGRVSRKVSRTKEPQCLAASYSRLSNEEGKKGQSIGNQKKLIKEFAARNPDIKIAAEYEDNGCSGTTFNRSGFEQMMEAVKTGKVNCVIVKDLSRFGRDFIETGDFIERIFPHIGVRFIAINDFYDSNNPECTTGYLTVALKNLVNELYARDISKKIQTVKHLQQERGEFTGSCPPYGYCFKGGDKKTLYIDPDGAEAVRMIFTLRDSGLSYRRIAQHMQDQGVPAPWLSIKEKGCAMNLPCKKDSLWHSEVIARILSNAVYTGCLLQRKTVTSYYDDKGCERIPRNRWIIIPDCHEAIINEEQFARINAMKRQNVQKPPEHKKDAEALAGHENRFKSILFCGDCGYAMSRKKIISNRSKGKELSQAVQKYAYTCKTYGTLGKKYCTSKHIMEEKLADIVSAAVFPMILQVCPVKDGRKMLLNKLSIVESEETIIAEQLRNLVERIDVFDTKKIQITLRFADLYGSGRE